MTRARTVAAGLALSAVIAVGCMPEDDLAAVDGLAEDESAIVGRSGIVGGRGGRPFHTANLDPDNRVIALQVRSGAEIDALIVYYADGLVERWGGTGGTLRPIYPIPPDARLESIVVRYGARIEAVMFFLSNGQTSPLYGGLGGDDSVRLSVPADGRFVGFQGRAQNRIDGIGLVWDTPARAVAAEGER
jgi:hypothetical protein